MSCTAEEIQEKKRLALERLKKTKETQSPLSVPNATTSTATSPGTSTKSPSTFYSNSVPRGNASAIQHQHENKMKQLRHYGQTSRILSQPYPKRDEKPTNNNNNAQMFMTSKEKVIACSCTMMSATRFQVITSSYSDKLIDIFKTIPKRAYSKYEWKCQTSLLRFKVDRIIFFQIQWRAFGRLIWTNTKKCKRKSVLSIR